ncbi:MAG: toll/interleukin-1 receptor domain-containing protein, partial [Pseudomonadota bacterium]
MAQVFISYSSADRERVGRLAQALEAQGLSVWWDHALMPGDDYREKIEGALAKADAVIVCWSAAAAASQWVQSEADDARQRGRLIPARLDGAVIPKPFDRLHTEDLSAWGGLADDPRILKLAEAARAMAEGRVARPVPWRRRVLTAGGVLGALGLAAAGVANFAGIVSLFDPPAATQESVERALDERLSDEAIARIVAETLAQEREAAAAQGQSLAPEAEDAIARAVESILRSGDARKAAAREALGEGRVQDAADGIAAVAEAQTGAVDEAAGAAAESWREAAALYRGSDPQRALEAYREAARMDPSDFWTWVHLRRLEQRQAGDAAAALAAAEQAQAAADSERDRSVALNDLGDAQLILGDLAAARTAYEESLELARALSASNPESAAARRDVSVSLERLGDVSAQAGDLAAARTAYEESLE